MSVVCEIGFENNPNKLFYAGQLLRGTVRLTMKEEKKVRGVYIRIYGKAYCRWTRNSGRRRVVYVGNEQYLDETKYLVGGEDGSVQIKRGTHTFNFQCNLPESCPTSVEGYIGYIRYTARVIVDIPMALDKEFKQRFTVIRPLNLNNHPEIRQSVISASNEFDCCSLFCCCFCILMQPIEVSAKIPVGGYTPGQTINLELHVKHKGGEKLYEFTVHLMKRIDYYAENVNMLNCCTPKGHNKDIQSVISKDVSCRIANTLTVEIVRVNLQVPPVPPTDFLSSNVVKVTYFLCIETSTGCCNGSPKNKIPITIGTYPIEDVDSSSNERPPPTAPLLNSVLEDSADKDLPTYEEAMDVVDAGDDNFKPKYPVFKRNTSYSSGH